jgi:hypothetical protein
VIHTAYAKTVMQMMIRSAMMLGCFTAASLANARPTHDGMLGKTLGQHKELSRHRL